MSKEEELVEGHYKEVYRLALRLSGNTDAAEDLTQVVFLRALQALPKFRGESSLRTWLYTITLNESRRRRAPTVLLDPEIEPRDLRPGPEALAAANLDAERLRKLIDRLPDNYREVVVLHYMQNVDLDEIASITRIPKNTVKTWLFRAREELREKWGEK